MLRVLFHTANYHNIGHNALICMVLTASTAEKDKKDRRKRSVMCSLRREEKDGTCLAQLTLPSGWWPSFTQKGQKADKETQAAKHPKVLVDVKYSAFETTGTTCSFRTKEERGGLQLPRVPVTPETPLGAITLIQPAQSYHQLAKDELMHMLMPQAPLYPNSKFYVPVFLQQPLTDQAPITAFTIKYG